MMINVEDSVAFPDGRLICKKLSLLDNEVYVDQQVPFGVLTGIRFKVLSEEDVNLASLIQIPKICKYCDRSFRYVYPPMKFKVSTKDVFGKTAIIAESSRKLIPGKSLPPDYWDFVPNDPDHFQLVYQILKDVNPSFLKGSLGKKNNIFLQSFPLTPNRHRVAEFGQNLTFIRAEKPLVRINTNANDDNLPKMMIIPVFIDFNTRKRFIQSLDTITKIRVQEPHIPSSLSIADAGRSSNYSRMLPFFKNYLVAKTIQKRGT
ncbi:hypothetical protein L1887_34386 [Cichorium endivia]|nr:hypothetical protein L1887_34386 [Cichorium endivia]